MLKSCEFSISDGIFQGILLVVLLKYIMSTVWSYSVADIPVLLILTVLSVFSSLFLLQKASDKLWKHYLLRGVFFVLMCILFFVNQLTLRLWLFPVPQRELADAEGIVISIAVLVFVFLFTAESVFGAIWKCKRRRGDSRIARKT